MSEQGGERITSPLTQSSVSVKFEHNTVYESAALTVLSTSSPLKELWEMSLDATFCLSLPGSYVEV